MKYCFFLWAFVCLVATANGQQSIVLRVNGDSDKFYPVIFKDNNWGNHVPTEIEIGRSDIHEDSSWHGTLMARFRFHTVLWGHASNFVDADIYQYRFGGVVYPFVAAYHDATLASGNLEFVVWLRGATTYHYRSNVAQSPKVYDNVQHLLPYQQENSGTHTFRTTVDPKINSRGKTLGGSIHLIGEVSNYISGTLGIGKLTATERLEVNGNIRAKEIKVEVADWPDYVFQRDYQLMSLDSVERFIHEKGHLPDIPNAAEVESNGASLGEMVKKLLQKNEELTLHLIEKSKQLEAIERRVKELEKYGNNQK